MPAARIRRLASALLPMARIASAGGPTKTSPAPGAAGAKAPVLARESEAGGRGGGPRERGGVGLHGLRAGGIGFGVDGHGAQAEPARRSHDADGDLAPV